jgi:UDP-N-acetylglucosamine:LPS N-acetylglucosamine transferase
LSKSKRVLAVASNGGHWEQIMLLSDAFEGAEVFYACTEYDQAKRYNLKEFFEIKDYNQSEPFKVIMGFSETFKLLRSVRPDVVISTGAAPGLLCIVWGRILGAKTIWVDSIANSERLSLSGRLALYVAHLVITQWEHLASEEGPVYHGSVI